MTIDIDLESHCGRLLLLVAATALDLFFSFSIFSVAAAGRPAMPTQRAVIYIENGKRSVIV